MKNGGMLGNFIIATALLIFSSAFGIYYTLNSSYNDKSEMLRDYQNEALSKLKMVAPLFDGLFFGAIHILKDTQEYVEYSGSIDMALAGYLPAMLREYVSESAWLGHIIIYDKNGVVVFHSQESSSKDNQKRGADEEFFIAHKDKRLDIHITRPLHISRFFQRNNLIFSAYISDKDGRFLGVIALEVKHSHLREKLSSLLSENGITVAIIDKETRNIVSKGDCDAQSSDTGKYIDTIECFFGVSGEWTSQDGDGYLKSNDKYFSKTTLSSIPANIISVHDAKNILEGWRETSFKNSILSVSFIVMATLISLVIIIWQAIKVRSSFGELSSIATAREEKYRFLFNSMDDGIVIHGFQENGMPDFFIEVNDSACKMLGYSKEELLKLRVQDIHPNEFLESIPNLARELFGGKHLLIEAEILRKDGTLFTAEVSSYLFIFGGKQTVFTSMRDLTEKIRAQREREEQEKLIIQQSKMALMGEMIAAIAHQWKQPLNAIALYTITIEDILDIGECDKESILEATESINRQLDFMSKTVEDFRNFFKEDRAKQHFSINKEIESVCRLLSQQMIKSKITLNTRLLDSFAFGYPNEFKQVILNIIANAKDAFADKDMDNKTILISTKTVGKYTIIEISDNAGGIPAHLLPDKLFESHVSTKGEKGTGIGLSLSKTIIEKHLDGKITARNEDNGALFVIVLPVVNV